MDVESRDPFNVKSAPLRKVLFSSTEELEKHVPGYEIALATTADIDEIAIGVDFFRNLGLIDVGQTGVAALIADNLRVTYSSCRVVWMSVF